LLLVPTDLFCLILAGRCRPAGVSPVARSIRPARGLVLHPAGNADG
jgi:hypothetical protein